MWFASYLHTKGIITGEQLAQALKLQLDDRPLLGNLAMREGKINANQFMKIIMAQANSQSLSFGTIAVELGFLTPDDVSQLLILQSESVPPLSAFLIKIGAITQEQKRRELALARQNVSECPTLTDVGVCLAD